MSKRLLQYVELQRRHCSRCTLELGSPLLSHLQAPLRAFLPGKIWITIICLPNKSQTYTLSRLLAITMERKPEYSVCMTESSTDQNLKMQFTSLYISLIHQALKFRLNKIWSCLSCSLLFNFSLLFTTDR